MQILPGWCPGSQRLICPRPQQPVRQQWADMCLRSDIIIIQLKVTVLELETKVHPKVRTLTTNFRYHRLGDLNHGPATLCACAGGEQQTIIKIVIHFL